jgi:TPR repeat protein
MSRVSALENKSVKNLYEALKFFKENEMHNYIFDYLCKAVKYQKIFSFDLAKCYLYGLGTEVNYELACYYFNISKKCGDKFYFRYIILINILLKQQTNIVNAIKEYYNCDSVSDKLFFKALNKTSNKFYVSGEKYFSVIIDKYIDSL